VAELLDTGRAIESKSPYSPPVHLVKKACKFRLVVDYRRLKKVTVRQIRPAARIDNLLAELAGSMFFTTLDLQNAFHQVFFASTRDGELAVFVTETGHYQFTCMPFGLMNSPIVFQRLIDKVTQPL
jgi:hypothetical protein